MSLVTSEVLSRRRNEAVHTQRGFLYRSDCLGDNWPSSGLSVESMESWQSPPKHMGSFSFRVVHGTLSGIMAPDKKNCSDHRKHVGFQADF